MIRLAHHFRVLPRCLAALVAVLFLLGDVMGFLHQAIEQHVACAEHGELLHTGDGGLSVERGPSQDSAVSARSPSPGQQHLDGDHCQLCPSSHPPSAVEVAAASGSTAWLEAGVVERSDGRELPGSQSIYRMAPKTSPPRA